MALKDLLLYVTFHLRDWPGCQRPSRYAKDCDWQRQLIGEVSANTEALERRADEFRSDGATVVYVSID